MLDLYCGVGGAGQGYRLAGWHVTGVDIKAMPRYSGDVFIKGDAVAYLREHGHEYDFVHASPPCQRHSALTKGTNKGRIYPELIAPTREALRAVGKPWIIENVAGAEIRKDLMLCGEMFGLAVIRHRYFELGGWSIIAPDHPPHRGRVAGLRHGVWYTGPYFAVYGDGGGKGTIAQWQEAMGIDWTSSRKELAEAIPPAYSRFIGSHALRGINEDR